MSANPTTRRSKGPRRVLRLLFLAAVALLPNWIKCLIYRGVLGYRVGERVRVGVSLLDAESLELGAGTHIGHFNVITGVTRFETGACARIGIMNIIRGGTRVTLDAYSEILRLNVMNAIPDHDCITEPQSVLEVGPGTVITSGHRIDFTDRVSLGRNVIIGGRNSSLWTHTRQETAPIRIGNFCYLGSEVRLAPGASLPDECILGLGAVLIGEIGEGRSLVAGVPATVRRPLNERDLTLIHRKTRVDTPDGFHHQA